MTKMVDISEKELSLRTAKARGEIKLKRETITAIKEKRIKKGDVVNTAQTAAVLAVKKTSNLIPLCHQVPVKSVEVIFDFNEDGLICECVVKAHYSTGVEMESLLGVSVALLTVWDMVKYLEKDGTGQYPDTVISGLKIVLKQKE